MRYALIFVALSLLFSCKPQQVSYERTVRDSVVIRDVEKEILIPRLEGQSNPINIDSLKAWFDSGKSSTMIENTIWRTDPETNLKVGILIDELGNLTAVCEKQEETIKFLIQEREKYIFEFERIVERERKNIFQELWKWLKISLIGLGVIVIGVIIFRVLK